MRALLTCAIAGLTIASATGCASIPRDPDGTLERVQASRILHAGASPSRGRVVTVGDEVSGLEPDLVTRFAESLEAEVRWRTGGEEELVAAMERHELDVIVGGLTDASPWSAQVSLTRPYAESVADGRVVRHVMAVPLGENALLVQLERFLDGSVP